jgi:tRNA(adenine34) deaminase
MKAALREAQASFEEDEVPVGAVVVCEQRIIARAHNQMERLGDATAHAEILAITAAQSYFGSKVLSQCSLYVTLEPCAMCAGAIFWTRIGSVISVIVGTRDEKRGHSRHQPSLLHPKTKYLEGIESQACEDILKDYFRLKRKKPGIQGREN